MSEIRRIKLYFDEENNAAAFPMSRHKEKNKEWDAYLYSEAFHPFEANKPYSVADMAEIIRQAYEAWEQYPAYEKKKSFEEAYYKISGFKNAMKGKRVIDVDWGDYGVGYGDIVEIDYMFPCRQKGVYLQMDSRQLSSDASWEEIAAAVIDLVEKDWDELWAFKTYKSKLLL
ncbi:MAG: hypothetical protein ACI4CT_02335 [Lachnospiraceae bacterium]